MKIKQSNFRKAILTSFLLLDEMEFEFEYLSTLEWLSARICISWYSIDNNHLAYIGEMIWTQWEFEYLT